MYMYVYMCVYTYIYLYIYTQRSHRSYFKIGDNCVLFICMHMSQITLFACMCSLMIRKGFVHCA